MSLLRATGSRAAERPRGANRGGHRRLLTGLVAVVTAIAATCLTVPGAAAASPPPYRPPAGAPDFGPNVKIFDPTMPIADIQATVDAVYAEQVDNEMGTQRYSLLFKPGTYGTVDAPVIFKVGYYTEVAGLGSSPTDVTINGHVDVYNRCLAPDNCIALNNFWRSLSNLTINVAGGSDGCKATANFWAVSQAAPVRRVNIASGNLSFMDYCSAGPQFASGGFMADSKAGVIVNGSQQQFLVRDSSVGNWSNAVWNQVFAGVQGAPAQSFPTPPYTTLDTNPVSREKPYLVYSENKYSVFVPSPRTDSVGTTWENGPTRGRSIPLSSFYLAKPGDSVRTINQQLARGKNLILTPGVYDIDQSIRINRARTVVLGLGVATLTATDGAVPIRVADVKGVDIAGIMIDAGPVNSPVLLQIGSARRQHGRDDDFGGWHHGDRSDPTSLQDVFFRIGGPHVGKATLSLAVNSDNVILDNIWAWRADHGVPGSFGWDINTAETGVIVNGDNVTATGLFVEHYQKYNVIWKGEKGKTIFFQNELPYDPPDQESWQHDGVPGWAAYKVADSVRTHELWGGGSYIFTNVNPTLHAARGFEVPVTPGVRLHALLTLSLRAGTIVHVVNDTGDPAVPIPAPDPVSIINLVSFP